MLQKRSITQEGGKLLDIWVFRDKKTKKICSAYHVARLYGLSQLKSILADTGLQVVRVNGGYEEQEYREDAKRLIIIAKRS
jgi:hypothetical protein